GAGRRGGNGSLIRRRGRAAAFVRLLHQHAGQTRKGAFREAVEVGLQDGRGFAVFDGIPKGDLHLLVVVASRRGGRRTGRRFGRGGRRDRFMEVNLTRERGVLPGDLRATGRFQNFVAHVDEDA